MCSDHPCLHFCACLYAYAICIPTLLHTFHSNCVLVLLLWHTHTYVFTADAYHSTFNVIEFLYSLHCWFNDSGWCWLRINYDINYELIILLLRKCEWAVWDHDTCYTALSSGIVLYIIQSQSGWFRSTNCSSIGSDLLADASLGNDGCKLLHSFCIAVRYLLYSKHAFMIEVIWVQVKITE